MIADSSSTQINGLLLTRKIMKYISLFAGVGGFDLALNRLGHECVYVNEWNKYSAQTYEKNLRHKPDTRSITEVPASAIPDHDLLVGGFPCQAFSVAGKRKGFDDTRGTLFFDIARIVKEKRPRYLLLENVKGLLSHDEGRTFKIILSTLTELHYDIQSMVLNSKNFGVPQNRERVFIVGHLRGTSRPKVFPIGKTTGTINQRLNERNSEIEIVSTIRSRYGNGTGSHVMRQPLKFLQRNQKNIEGDYSFTIDSVNTGGLRIDDRIRRLTPMECERLQGFPDNFTAGVSDSQRYKQMGNAVTVNVVEYVARLLVS